MYNIIILLLTILIIASCVFGPETKINDYYYLTLMNCDGSEKIQVSQDFVIYNQTQFTPDNQKIFFKENGIIYTYELFNQQIQAYFPDDLDVFNITRYVFYDDFDELIYWNHSDDWDLYYGNVSTGDYVNLTNTPQKREEEAKLSPSNELIAFIEKDFSYADSVLWSIKYRNLDGSIENTVTSRFGTVLSEYKYVDWINEDKLLLIDRDPYGSPGLYSIGLDGSNKQQLSAGSYIELTICNDRSRVVFENDEEIYLLNTSDLSTEYISQGKEAMITPDGNKVIYFCLGEEGSFRALDLNDNSFVNLSDFANTSALAISNDSQKFIYVELIRIEVSSK
jgi:hypothetical protein